MKTSLFDYELGPELIAQTPSPSRSESRLLVLDRKGDACVAPTMFDRRFAEVGQFLRAGDCLVLNDTKVLPARFAGATGRRWKACSAEQARGRSCSSVARPGRRTHPILDRSVGWASPTISRRRKKAVQCTPYEAELVEKRSDGVCILRIDSDRTAEEILEEVGFPPLPPYIRRDGDIEQATEDRQRYQTVYARRPGAVAAPTAGLHFTEPLLNQLQQQGVHLAWVTLHVGTGTFKPVTAENLEDHEIHSEWYEVDTERPRDQCRQRWRPHHRRRNDCDAALRPPHPAPA